MTRILLAESLLRLSSLIFASLCACVLGFNEETKMFIQEKTMETRNIHSFWILMFVTSVASVYHFIQFCKCLVLGKWPEFKVSKKWTAWISLSFDQVILYAMFGTVAAAIQTGLLSMTGQEQFQWMETSGFFKRFSRQSIGGLACAVVAAGSMALLNVITSHQAFGGLHVSNPKLSSLTYV